VDGATEEQLDREPSTPVTVTAASPPRPRAWSKPQSAALSAASAVFLRRIGGGAGVEGSTALGQVTVDQIARYEGVSRRAVYNQWSSMADLRRDLLQRMVDAQVGGCRSALRRTPSVDDLPDALLPAPAPDQIPVWHAVLAFLVDAHDSATERVLTTGFRDTLAVLQQWIEANWSPEARADPGIDDATLAVVMLALISGVSRLRRTCPPAAPSNAAVAAVLRLLGDFSLAGWPGHER
jgi:AcrR family transcriptional regulator